MRYAETDGFEFDQARPDAWRYRDWVVDALNGDMPYDRFVRLQLAGDEVAPDDPAAFIATGFNRCYPDMVDLNDQGLRRQNALDDITETTGLVFLGLTIGCARCHDHKFDPIRQADYYRLQAFFTPVAVPRRLSARARPRGGRRTSRRWPPGGPRSPRSRRRSSASRSRSRDRIAPGLPMGALDDAVAAYNTPEAERTPAEVATGLRRCSAATGGSRPADWPRPARPGRVVTRGRTCSPSSTASTKAAPRPLPTARGIDEAGPDAPPTYFLRRGELHRARAGRRARRSRPCSATADRPARRSRRRPIRPAGARALADWLTRPDHPLTARVMVNRLWQHHFGRGLVATSSDFGTMGDEPSHPELLDWLATELVARGWSLKAMHRLIVTSATYRQSSRPRSPAGREADPENRWLCRQNRRRLDGEAIRDALLAGSGRLEPGPGRAGRLPAAAPRADEALEQRGDLAGLGHGSRTGIAAASTSSSGATCAIPFFEAFDRPDTNASCPKRPGHHDRAAGAEPAQQPALFRGGPCRWPRGPSARPVGTSMRRSSGPIS